jgi:hypothetical protein
VSSPHTQSDRHVGWLQQGHVVMPQMFNARYSLNIILGQFGGCLYGRDCMIECTERSHGCPRSIFLSSFLGHPPSRRGVNFYGGRRSIPTSQNLISLSRMGGLIVGEGLGGNFCLRMCWKQWSMEDVVFKFGVVCLTRAWEGFTVSRDVWMWSSTHLP